ncbi:MAG: glycerophosphodiester phosphodiesterase [Desulfobacteraceae bacterium]|nr:glycerophosphodiester phosphodiesterase [Desulfobacteraceae bacterium]
MKRYKNTLQHWADTLCAKWPQKSPSAEKLKSCKIIAHRGVHDNLGTIENTLTAFEKAIDIGIWGIEFDVRWSADSVPVVYHDMDLKRLHRSPRLIHKICYEELSELYPSIPSLSEVVRLYGGRLHFMAELKKQPMAEPAMCHRNLFDALEPLKPIKDYHLMALNPGILQTIRQIPAKALVAVSSYLPCSYSQWVIKHNWGGLCSHYALMSSRMIRHHRGRRQSIGTGYPKSRYCLYRELNRGVDWIFTNHATDLQAILNKSLKTQLRYG